MAVALIFAITTAQRAISDILLKTNKLNDLRMQKVKQGEILKRDTRDTVGSYERSIERMLSRGTPPQAGLYTLAGITSADQAEIAMPILGPDVFGTCGPSGRMPRVSDLYLRDSRAAVATIGDGQRPLEADLRDFILNSGRLTGLSEAMKFPTQVFPSPPQPGQPHPYNINPYQTEATAVLRITAAPTQQNPRNVTIVANAAGVTLTPAERLQPNVALDHLLQLARTGASSYTQDQNLRDNQQFRAQFMPTQPNQDPREFAIQKLMENPEVLRLFARTTREYGHQWQNLPGNLTTEKALDDAIIAQIRASRTTPTTGQRLTTSIPIFAHSAQCHLQRVARNRGSHDSASIGNHMQYVNRWTHNPRSTIAFEVDSCVEMRKLGDVRRDLEDLDDNIQEDVSNIDREMQTLKTDKDYWDKQLQVAQAELPRAVARPWGGQNT